MVRALPSHRGAPLLSAFNISSNVVVNCPRPENCYQAYVEFDAATNLHFQEVGHFEYDGPLGYQETTLQIVHLSHLEYAIALEIAVFNGARYLR